MIYFIQIGHKVMQKKFLTQKKSEITRDYLFATGMPIQFQGAVQYLPITSIFSGGNPLAGIALCSTIPAQMPIKDDVFIHR